MKVETWGVLTLKEGVGVESEVNEDLQRERREDWQEEKLSSWVARVRFLRAEAVMRLIL